VKKWVLPILCLAICSCVRSPGEVVDKVLADFGVGERPEGYVSGSDTVEDRLRAVGQTELKRLNMENRDGTIEFQDAAGLQGKFYKQVKVYEKAFPVEATAVSKSGPGGDRGYSGYIDYQYRIYESERRNTRTEAAALDANIRTDQTGRERLRYYFTPAGTWDGAEGTPVKR
jgi:hypothetical protein